MSKQLRNFSIILLAALLIAACASTGSQQTKLSYTLKTDLQNGKMVFVGVGGPIDGVVNPTLEAAVGDIVQVKLINGDGSEQNISFPDFSTTSTDVSSQGSSTSIVFGVDKAGSFSYFSDLPGQREAGMEGTLEVAGVSASAISSATAVPATLAVGTDNTAMPGMGMSSASASPASSVSSATAVPATGADIVRDPTDLPGPIGNRAPTTVRIDLEAKEVVGQLADGTTYPFWTFNGKVPGPFFRVRVGDTVEVHLKNDPGSIMPHSVDFHAVTGPGGGAVFTTTAPGAETVFSFKALKPGLYVYHCATPMVAEHISSGMYGMILVEPEGGLPKVDHEYYIMQGELYTSGNFGDKGAQAADVSKLLNENSRLLCVQRRGRRADH